jgi:photosystem II stability/assembly factor-like uncharacterized protein
MRAAARVRAGGRVGRRTRLVVGVVVTALLVPAGAAGAQAPLWTEVSSGTQFKVTAVDYHADDRLWYATEKGEIFRRVGGVPQLQLPATGIPFNDIAFRPGGDVGIAVGNSGTLYRTTDGGAMWLQLSGLQTLDHDCVSGQDTLEAVGSDLLSLTWADASTVYISGKERVVLRSTDAGVTFIERNKKPDRTCRTSGLLHDITDSAFAGGVGYLASDGTAHVWRTGDGLATDSLAGARAVECGTRPQLALDPVDLNRLWAVDRCSTATAFRYSEDGGASFATVGLPGDVQNGLNDVAVAPGILIAVGNAGEILISRDGRTASRWPAAGTLNNRNWQAVDLADGARGAIGGDDGVLLTTTSADSVPVSPGATPPGGPFPAPAPPGGSPQDGTQPGGGAQGGAASGGSPQQGGGASGGGAMGGGAQSGTLGTSRAKAGVELRMRARRLLGGRLRLRVTGRLVPPAGIDRAAACRGRVRLAFRSRGKTIARRRVAVGPSCRFGSRISAPTGGTLVGARRLRVRARFVGNSALLPAGGSVSRRLG